MRRVLRQSTSGGVQKKFIENGYCYKIDRLGYESVSEVIISELESCIEGFKYIDYEFANINNGHACKSKEYKVKGLEITLHRLLEEVVNCSVLYEDYDGVELLNRIEGILSVYHNYNPHRYFGKLIKLDAITLNSDRHTNNISFIRNNNTILPMPVYDNGAALLSDIKTYPLVIGRLSMVSKVMSKPFSNNFDEQLSYFEDVEPLRINYSKFEAKVLKALNKIDLYVPKSQQTYFKAALEVLFLRLKETKNKAWVEI